MVAELDVFSAGTKPNWLGCAETLQQAIELFRRYGAGSYLVLSQETGHRKFFEVSLNGDVRPGATVLKVSVRVIR